MTMYSPTKPLMRVLRGSNQESDAMLVTKAGWLMMTTAGLMMRMAGLMMRPLGLLMRTSGA